tara:strand:+ start:1176 stop:1385 length:210 start_codon:yes stop_codon:yes gene_type:complete
MNYRDSENKLDGLEAIKSRALGMAQQGADALEVRDFIKDAKTELAYEVPDVEKFKKARSTAAKFKGKKD